MAGVASEAIGGYGVKLRMSGTEIAEITDITPPGLSRDTFEASHHQSPDRWKEFRKALKDGGEVSLTIQYIPTNSTHNAATGILSDFADDTTIRSWDLVFPDTAATTWTFSAIVTGFAPGPDREGKLSADVTLKVSGKPTLY